MPLHVVVRYPRPDIEKTTDAIHAYMSDKIIEAVKTYVFATTDVIPVWSGASKASFLKLAFFAKVQLAISPVVKSRIPLGIETSTGEVFTERGKIYGFNWASDLYYIHIVDQRVRFVERGEAKLRSIKIGLPPIIISNRG